MLMKKLIVCLSLAAFATLSLQAGENCNEKTATTAKAQAACSVSKATTACCASKTAKVAKRAHTVKGAQLLLLARR
jgi:hypothetical protein